MSSSFASRPGVAIVGLGRVGLPLALSFADSGLDVLGIDVDAARVETISAGVMPFVETGMQEVLGRVAASRRLRCSAQIADAAVADHIVLTLGTPSLSHIEIDMRQIRAALDGLMPHLRRGHSIVLRSTVAPGTTDFVAGYIEQRRGLVAGEDIYVAHAPERIAEGRFLEEIRALPCIVGGIGEASGRQVGELFSVLGARIVQTTPAQAELAKIWSNIYRYVNFALPNLLMMDCEQHGANVHDVIDMINDDYPRGGIKRPGLTAGTCLRKDFAFSEEKSNAPGMLLAVSRVNESVPLFLVKGLKERLGGSLRGKRVAVLGLAFKGDSDDERDSLAFKVIRLLERELAVVAIHDPHVPTPTESLRGALRGAHAVVVAANHSEFGTAEARAAVGAVTAPGCIVADPWDVLALRAVFAEVGPARAAAPAESLGAAS